MSEERKLYNIFHEYEVDGGFGDPVGTESLVGTVWATEKEIDEFVAKWNKPVVYDIPYYPLTCHAVSVEEVDIVDIDSFEPYEEDVSPYGTIISENPRLERNVEEA